MTKPQVKLSLRNTVRVEIGGKRGNIPNIGVVYKCIEGDWSTVEKI